MTVTSTYGTSCWCGTPKIVPSAKSQHGPWLSESRCERKFGHASHRADVGRRISPAHW